MGMNNLVLSTLKDEEQADDQLMALTTIASKARDKDSPLAKYERMLSEQMGKTKAPAKKRKKRSKVGTLDANGKAYRSRFFYKPTKSLVQVIDESKAAIEQKPELDYENEDSLKRLTDLGNELPPALADNIDAVREYFLKIAPKALAANAGLAQFMDLIQRSLGTEIDPRSLGSFQHMVDRAQLILMSKFVAEYMGLSQEDAQALLEAAAPGPQQVIFMGGPQPGEERRQRPSDRQPSYPPNRPMRPHTG